MRSIIPIALVLCVAALGANSPTPGENTPPELTPAGDPIMGPGGVSNQPEPGESRVSDSVVMDYVIERAVDRAIERVDERLIVRLAEQEDMVARRFSRGLIIVSMIVAGAGLLVSYVTWKTASKT